MRNCYLAFLACRFSEIKLISSTFDQLLFFKKLSTNRVYLFLQQILMTISERDAQNCRRLNAKETAFHVAVSFIGEQFCFFAVCS